MTAKLHGAYIAQPHEGIVGSAKFLSFDSIEDALINFFDEKRYSPSEEKMEEYIEDYNQYGHVNVGDYDIIYIKGE